MASITLDGNLFFWNGGTCLALYPHDQLAEDVASDFPKERRGFPCITLAHNTKTKDEVDEVLKLAEQAGGKIEKSAQIASWGGYRALLLRSGWFPAGGRVGRKLEIS
jgi:hypothetical protein